MFYALYLLPRLLLIRFILASTISPVNLSGWVLLIFLDNLTPYSAAFSHASQIVFDGGTNRSSPNTPPCPLDIKYLPSNCLLVLAFGYAFVTFFSILRITSFSYL